MSEFGIPAKLLRLCEMALKNVQCVVMVGNILSKPFEAKRDFKQSDSLSSDFFNILMEKIICAAGLRHMPLAYADDVDVIGRSICEVEAAFSKFAEEARSIGLAVNENKTKLFLSTAKDTSIGVCVERDGYNFEVVKDFVYLGSSINTDNVISLQIRYRITLTNRCYFGQRKQLSKALSWRTKTCLYKSLILSVLLYSAETWTLTSSE